MKQFILILFILNISVLAFSKDRNISVGFQVGFGGRNGTADKIMYNNVDYSDTYDFEFKDEVTALGLNISYRTFGENFFGTFFKFYYLFPITVHDTMTISQGGVGVLQKATNHYDDYKTAFILGLNIGPSKQFVFSTYRILIDFGFGAQLDAFKFKDEGGGNADLGIGIFANAAFQCDIVKPLYFEVGIHGELDMALGVYAIPNYEIESTDFIWQISPYACIGFRF